MEKRYQIFISSTYSDLIEEREQVMRAVLEQGCFPAGMEQFPAAGIPPIEMIKKFLKECDYYILIIGGRYGSINKKTGLSYTEEEYDFAVSEGIPVIAFIHDNPKSIPAGKTDEDDEKREKLKKFREKVEEGGITVRYWSTADNLKSSVLGSISKAIEFQERTGWIRADAIPADKEAYLKELDVLREERIKHQNELRAAKEKIKNLETNIKKLKASIAASHSSGQPLTEEFSVGGIRFRMVHVAGGTFKMGANEGDSEARDNEKSAHNVSLTDYWIGETQVTQALWIAVMGENPSFFSQSKGYSNDLTRPVERVNWNKCQEFIERLNEQLHEKLDGRTFRLPTEAEWEFAARGGNIGKVKNFKYAGSNNIDEVSWYGSNSYEVGRDNPDYGPHAVAKKKPNDLGLYDMSGNVWEWCQDEYISYPNSPEKEPKDGANSAKFYVNRGGGWSNRSWRCRVSYRGKDPANEITSNIGLRLALVDVH